MYFLFHVIYLKMYHKGCSQICEVYICFVRYLYGNKVRGTAFVVFGVIDNEKKISIAASLQRVQVSSDRAVLYNFITWSEKSSSYLACLRFIITTFLL